MKDVFQMYSIIEFTSRSYRSASTSKAPSLKINLDLVLQQACCENNKTIYKDYFKEISENFHASDDADFSKTI